MPHPHRTLVAAALCLSIAIGFTSTVVPSSFTGAIDAAGDLVGTYRQGSLSLPVTFHRTRSANR